MEVDQLRRTFHLYRASLFNEGFLDEQFVQLQQLQDESNPGLWLKWCPLFFEDSERLLNDLRKALDQENVDFRKIDAHVHQLKGSSSSIGAQRVRDACIAFRDFCDERNIDERNIEACLKCLQQVREEYLLVKTKLEALLRLEQQIVAAGGASPM
ncbi:UNVERIFIED_CONTAM: Histidine-containing phosphotransfer protein 1 [Sesamum angustifolium]|uniref:Histidine-containing phosphotransfer protein n=1 Tax=Sesamum angustifolium TaxID=2727405 RepID=A0AAW2NXX4_9LAMI